jgi:predicted acetyltransferase
MTEIRTLSPDDFDALTHIFATAYPGVKIVSGEERERFKKRVLELHEREPTASFYGLFRQGKLQGIMCLYDFSMNFLGTRIPAGGVGQLAVDLPHKKEHVAKEMVLFFLQHYRDRGAPFVALYPFRPDFYRRMGFGYGTKMNQYRLRPDALPKGPSKAHVRYLGDDDRQALVDCYHRFVDRTHGMIEKAEREIKRLFENPQNQMVGCEMDGRIRGYLVYTFEHGEDFITNDIVVKEFIAESREALLELVTFLHTQADQVRLVVFETQDEDFHHLLLDPRNDSGRLFHTVHHETNAQGVGLMYRVVDVPRILDLLSERDFGGQTCALKLTIEDSFLPDNAGSSLLHFESGRVQRLEGGAHNVEIRLDIADFSSLLAGTVRFQSLCRYGLADISDADYVDVVDRVFAVKHKPMCVTQF